MIIRNTSTKIIGVKGQPLMPDAEMPMTEADMESPAVQLFVSRGMLKVIEEEKKVESKAETTTEEKTEVKTRTRKAKE